MKVIVDSREPRWVQDLAFGGAEVSVAALEAGDVWVTCADGALIVVERKEPADLVASISDRRLFHQAAKMRAASDYTYLVVTEPLHPSRDGRVCVGGGASEWQWASIQGALLDVQAMGTQVVFGVGNDFEAVVLRLAKRDRSGTRVLAPLVQAREMTASEQILTSLPGVGLERARSLLDTFGGNPAKALAWLCSVSRSGTEVAGIGPTTRKRVRQALCLGDNEQLLIAEN